MCVFVYAFYGGSKFSAQSIMHKLDLLTFFGFVLSKVILNCWRFFRSN